MMPKVNKWLQMTREQLMIMLVIIMQQLASICVVSDDIGSISSISTVKAHQLLVPVFKVINLLCVPKGRD